MAANTKLAGADEAQELRARIEALNEEHELLLSTAVKQDEDIASAHRALQVVHTLSPVTQSPCCHACIPQLHHGKPGIQADTQQGCCNPLDAERMQQRQHGSRNGLSKRWGWRKRWRLPQPSCRRPPPGSSATLLSWSRSAAGGRDRRQQSAAEAEAAAAQVAQLQGLLEDAHRQLGAAKVGAFAVMCWFLISAASAVCETGSDASAGGSGPDQQRADHVRRWRQTVWSGMRTQPPCGARRSALLGPRHEAGCSGAPA